MFNHSLAKEGPVLAIDIAGGLVSFVIAAGWWKGSEREANRGSEIFLAKMFGGITLLGMIFALIL